MNGETMKRLLSAGCLAMLCLVGCGTARTDPYLPPEADLGGAVITILHPAERSDDVAEEMTGDGVSDAIYLRDAGIEERLHIRFAHRMESDLYSRRSVYLGLIRAALEAGDPAFDLVYGLLSSTVESFTEGLYENLARQPAMQLDEAWWCADQTEALSIAGALYGAFGSSTPDLYREAGVIFVNRDLARDLGLEDARQAVLDGEWTFDLLASMAQAAVSDLDGDGVMTPETDRYGFLGREKNNRTLQTSFGIEMIVRGADGLPVIAEPDERAASLIGRTAGFFSRRDGAVYVNEGIHGDADDAVLREAFAGGRALFLLERLRTAEQFRETQTDYAVLPYPKADGDQAQYVTPAPTAAEILMIPVSAADAENSALIAEALSYYGHAEVIPAFCSRVLKAEYVQDEESARVMDVIFSRMRPDLTNVYASVLGGEIRISQIYEACAFSGVPYASVIASYKAEWEERLKDIAQRFAAE